MWMCLKLVWAQECIKVATKKKGQQFKWGPRNMFKLLKWENMLRKPLTASPFTPRSAETWSPWDCLVEFGKWGQSFWRFGTIQNYILYMFQESPVVHVWILSMILLVHTWFGISTSDITVSLQILNSQSSHPTVLFSRCDVLRYIGVLLLSVGTFWNKAQDVLQNLGFHHDPVVASPRWNLPSPRRVDQWAHGCQWMSMATKERAIHWKAKGRRLRMVIEPRKSNHVEQTVISLSKCVCLISWKF